ncbi:MAG: L-2-amino-thiazoline-4-carboxylic acid hydrolase [Anaerolineae bacterium]|nr:L-2-amino-thiazoline-4-carboxylic acid hydrolase [Anaerolineae bacterium]
MNHLPCRERVFPFRICANEFYTPYLRWFRHLSERLGVENTLAVWRAALAAYDDTFTVHILSAGWTKVALPESNPNQGAEALLDRVFPAPHLDVTGTAVRDVIESTPPIPQVRRCFGNDTVEKEITAFEALHLRFDGLAYLAETIIKNYGKQGELIVYDLMVAGRLAAAHGETGSVEEFIEDFTAVNAAPSLFTAGLRHEVIHKTRREAVLHVRECEWARYFRERHPTVGYLMACSTDEVAYKAYNAGLRMQRTSTLMEGGAVCDFWIYTLDPQPPSTGE